MNFSTILKQKKRILICFYISICIFLCAALALSVLSALCLSEKRFLDSPADICLENDGDMTCKHEKLNIQITDANGVSRLFQSGTRILITEDFYFIFPEGSDQKQISVAGAEWQAAGNVMRLDYEALERYGKACTVIFRAYDGEEESWKDRSYIFYTDLDSAPR